jgi:hypothetical protein
VRLRVAAQLQLRLLAVGYGARAHGYPKGRDWFDLVWYRSRRPPVEPNLRLLQRALDQTQGADRYRAADWLGLVRARLADLDAAALARDVAPFLERPADAALLERINIEAVLTGGGRPA